jgi:hypothetical protein
MNPSLPEERGQDLGFRVGDFVDYHGPGAPTTVGEVEDTKDSLALVRWAMRGGGATWVSQSRLTRIDPHPEREPRLSAAEHLALAAKAMTEEEREELRDEAGLAIRNFTEEHWGVRMALGRSDTLASVVIAALGLEAG